MLKTGSYVYTCESPDRKGSAERNLISNCIASGVKSAAKDNDRRLYGTGEVAVKFRNIGTHEDDAKTAAAD
jgi:hypothetical protein